MAINPFKQQKEFAPTPNRNNFDCSFTNNGTFNFGYLYPVLCHEVMPGDKTVIDPRMALRALPLVFPIQTRVRAHLHFFYQRNRNLWDGFTDFINGNVDAGTPGHSDQSKASPYIDDRRSPSLFRTGSLGDYLGIPTTIPNSISPVSFDFQSLDFFYPSAVAGKLLPVAPYYVASSTAVTNNNLVPDASTLVVGRITDAAPGDYLITNYSSDFNYNDVRGNNSLSNLFRLSSQGDPHFISPYAGVVFPSSNGSKRFVVTVPKSSILLHEGRQFALLGVYKGDAMYPSDWTLSDAAASALEYGEVYHKYPVSVSSIVSSEGVESWRIVCDVEGYVTTSPYTFLLFCGDYLVSSLTKNNSGVVKYECFSLSDFPDYIDNGVSVFSVDLGNSVSALPFRCYESIYNAFYRDSRNNPFIWRGQTFYNKYLASSEGGLDTYPYGLRSRNWELDMFTSCVQSPQQGVAPLVGISSLGEVTFSDEDGKSYTFATETAPDADTITNVKVTENVPNSVARSIVNLVSSGISINDFRNVNAFQRWKETNIRRGLKFKDQIKARWGVDVSYNTLDMPEFLGGISVDIDVNSVNQTSETPEAPLGSYAGQASAFGSSNNKISCYSDEHGFIMCILSIVPVPCYTQTLPRYFRRFSPLDYYSPEFGKIGMQSVTLRDLCPVNAVASQPSVESQSSKLNEVFGYNRPWPEYLSRLDEAHGDFRTTLKNFLLMREFAGVPELGSDFTTIKPHDLNNVFATEEGDKFMGAIYFDIQCKRPIPSISVPALE